MKFPKADILNVQVDSLTMQEAVESGEEMMASGKHHLIATCNAEMIMMAQEDKAFKAVLESADLVVPDGAGTVWAANYLGVPMPERVAGIDLVKRLFSVSERGNYRVFFFGSAPGVVEKAKENMLKLFPNLNVVGMRNGYFSEADEPEILRQINEAKPHLLLVALGVPKQEKWISKYRDRLPCLCIGVGGTFDVLAGLVKRAPVWMQKARLEWLYRGMKQPSRMGRLMALPKFVMAVRKYKKS